MIIRFTDCEVDLDRVEIRRGGELVPVEPQVFDVLAYLLEHRERVVTKEELLDNIWGDRFVSESALTSRIKSARQAIGDNGRDQAVIKTIHGRGYRFVASAEVATPQHVSPPRPAAATAPSATSAPAAPSEAAAPDDDRWPLVGRHDDLQRLDGYFHDQRYAGVLLTGPAGVGKTRLATECVARAEATGTRTLRISGHSESAGIPLGAVSHLLPQDVLEVAGQDAELTRAVVFQRARSALTELGDDRRLVALVDNVDHLDELSGALVGSLLTSGAIFAIMTQRTSSGDLLAFDALVRSQQVAHHELGPLDDTDLDVLLYRVLSGPIDLQSLEQLSQLARGRPGALRQLVDTCRATGALDRRDGVWRLVGPIQAMVGPPELGAVDDLPPAVAAGAELLAIASELDLDMVTELLDADVLDALDRAGLLALTDTPNGSRVSLAQPHVGVLLLERLGPLRARRHKLRLVNAYRSWDELTPTEVLRATRWAIETGDAPDRDDVVIALRHAVSIADATNGEVLIEHLLRTAPGPDVDYLRAELAFRLGQVEAADEQLANLRVDDLDPADAVRVRRRRATILFHVRGRYEDAIELLTTTGEDHQDLLRTHAIGLLGFLGMADRIDELVSKLPADLDGPPALEVLRGRAQRAFVRGHYHDALDLLATHRTASSGLEPAAAQAGDEVALAIQIDAHVLLGEIDRALDLVHTHLPVGRRTLLAWLPLAACRALLAAGRSRAARALIMTPLAAVRSQNLLHAEPLMTGALAQATARLGDADAARAQLEVIERARPSLSGHLRWGLTRAIGDTRIALGDRNRAVELARDDVDDAIAHGAPAVAADLLTLVAAAGEPDEAAPVLRPLAAEFDGVLWPIRVRHVEALADGSAADLAAIAGEYEALGYRHLSDLASARPAP